VEYPKQVFSCTLASRLGKHVAPDDGLGVSLTAAEGSEQHSRSRGAAAPRRAAPYPWPRSPASRFVRAAIPLQDVGPGPHGHGRPSAAQLVCPAERSALPA